jgi:uncharacterized protein (DUF2062 family)
MSRVTLKQRIQEIWQRLARLDATPREIATGFSIGIASGFVPFNPSPIILATATAWLARRNVLAAVIGATLSILYTPLLPLLWLSEYGLGKLILPVHSPTPGDRAQLWEVLQKGWDAYAAMLVGSIIIGGPFTLLSYWVAKELTARWDRKKKASQPLN